MKKTFSIVSRCVATVLWVAWLCAGGHVWAESSTRFNTFVPAWNDTNNRFGALIVTATGDGLDGVTTVDVWDMPADTCPGSGCDAYGLIDEGADGTISNGNRFSSPCGRFVDADIDRYIVPIDASNSQNDQALRITSVVDDQTVTLDASGLPGESGLG